MGELTLPLFLFTFLVQFPNKKTVHMPSYITAAAQTLVDTELTNRTSDAHHSMCPDRTGKRRQWFKCSKVNALIDCMKAQKNRNWVSVTSTRYSVVQNKSKAGEINLLHFSFKDGYDSGGI